jgi:hypothetical protein
MANVPIDQTFSIDPAVEEIVIPPEAVFVIDITRLQMSAADPTVIENVIWEMKMTYGQYKGTVNGAVKLGSPNPDNFIPVADLTKTQVIEWVEAQENMQEMKERMVQAMNERLRVIIERPVFKPE